MLVEPTLQEENAEEWGARQEGTLSGSEALNPASLSPAYCSTSFLRPFLCHPHARHLKGTAGQPLCLRVDCQPFNTSFSFVRNDFLDTSGALSLDRKKARTIPWFESVGGWSNLAAVVLNRGAHFVEDSMMLHQLNETLRALRAARPDLLIIYRNTPPGHTGCKRYDKPLVERQGSEGLPHHWGEFARQNERSRRMVEAVGGVWWDVDSSTALRADGHLSMRGDCLHHCSPGPIDTWTHVLHHLLVNVL